mmetsp:Transcript_7365/g.14762  ORF Transcript_7365/g.14762 Transcript_7365/m.14762 type:complete len:217 (-) Transcript_7365:1138-1788(-)
MIVVENNTNSIVTNAMVSHLDGQRQQCQHAAFHAENSNRSNNHGPIRVGNYAVQQPRKGFKGDTDLMVDELISACQKNESQLQDVGDLQKTKKERTLVPFFAGGEAVDGALSSALEWPVGRGNNHHHGMTVKNGRGKAHEKKDDAKRNKRGKKQVTGDANNKPAKAVFQQQGYGKPTHKQGHHEQRQQQKGRYAGPAFTVSPVPEKLPMPSKLFLS